MVGGNFRPGTPLDGARGFAYPHKYEPPRCPSHRRGSLQRSRPLPPPSPLSRVAGGGARGPRWGALCCLRMHRPDPHSPLASPTRADGGGACTGVWFEQIPEFVVCLGFPIVGNLSGDSGEGDCTLHAHCAPHPRFPNEHGEVMNDFHKGTDPFLCAKGAPAGRRLGAPVPSDGTPRPQGGAGAGGGIGGIGGPGATP